MSDPTELPQLVGEFVDLSKGYLEQETLEPAKKLGRYAGYSIGAGFAFALGAFFLAFAGTRGIIALLPEGPYWSALGYILGALALGIIIALIVSGVQRAGPEDTPPPDPGALVLAAVAGAIMFFGDGDGDGGKAE